VRTIFLIYLNYKKHNFISSLKIFLSSSYFKIFFSRDYIDQIKKNSSINLRTVQYDISQFCSGVIMPIIDIILELGIFLILIILLALYDLNLTIISFFIFFLSACAYLFFTKIIIKKISKERLINEANRIKVLTESNNLIREIILNSKLSYFLNQFNVSNEKVYKSIRDQGIIQSSVRYLFEVVIILTIFVLMFLYLNSLNYSNERMLISIGILVVMLLKITPSIQKIIIAINSLIYSKPAMDNVFNQFTSLKNHKTKKRFFNNNTYDDDIFKINSIKLKNIYFNYPGDKRDLISNFSLEIKNKGLLGIFGVSGSGKTTLIDLLSGLLKPTKGQVLINDEDLEKNLKSYYNKIAYIPQDIYLFEDTLKKNIIFEKNIDEKTNNSRFLKSISLSKVDQFIDKLNQGIETDVGEKGINLSAGQIQRVGIARSLFKDAQILILDEPTSNLDHINALEILKDLKNLSKEKLIIIVSHDLKLIDYCDTKIVFENNKIIIKK